MRFPCCFICSRSCIVTGLGSSATGGRLAVELGDLPQPEVAVLELGVWNGELRFAHGAVAVPHDVEVERARTPPHRPHAAPLRFNRVQLREQLARLERCLE